MYFSCQYLFRSECTQLPPTPPHTHTHTYMCVQTKRTDDVSAIFGYGLGGSFNGETKGQADETSL